VYHGILDVPSDILVSVHLKAVVKVFEITCPTVHQPVELELSQAPLEFTLDKASKWRRMISPYQTHREPVPHPGKICTHLCHSQVW
jgi:hypothetical protein